MPHVASDGIVRLFVKQYEFDMTLFCEQPSRRLDHIIDIAIVKEKIQRNYGYKLKLSFFFNINYKFYEIHWHPNAYFATYFFIKIENKSLYTIYI